MRIACRLLTFVLISAAFLFSQSRSGQQQSAADAHGTITGTVVDENGNRVPRATVSAVGPAGVPSARAIPRVEADDQGRFTINLYPLGEYAVSAGKEQDGYPEKWTGLDGRYVVRVKLTQSNLEADIHVPLGPKGGVIIGTVRDRATGAPINPCAEFRRVAEPKNFMSGTGLINATFHRLVPSNVAFTLRVWVDGHKTWYYPGVEQPDQAKPLKLGPGDEVGFDILLEPDATRKNAGCGMPVGTIVHP